MEVRRGDLVTISLPGAYGKPRPALVVQDDGFSTLRSITVLPLTSMLKSGTLVAGHDSAWLRHGAAARLPGDGGQDRDGASIKIGERIGELDGSVMKTIEGALSRFLGLGLTP